MSYRKAYYDEKKVLGLCVDCYNYAEPGKVRCGWHLFSQREYSKQKINSLIAQW